MIRRIVILAALGAWVCFGPRARGYGAVQADEVAPPAISIASNASGVPETAAPSAGPTADAAPDADRSAPSTRRSAAAKSSPLSWLTDPIRKVFDSPGGSAKTSGRGGASSSRNRGAAKHNAPATDESTHPEAPLPIATRTMPSQEEPPTSAASPQPAEAVVATRFTGAAERRPAETGESGLSPEPLGGEPGTRRMSVEQLLDKGAASLQVGAVSLAGNYFREAIGESPDDPSVVVRAGVTALRHNRPELTVDLVEPAIERFPSTDSLRQVLAMAKYRRGEYLGARALLQQALAIDKSSAATHYVLGCTLAKLDQREQAESHLRQAAQLDPKYASPR